MVGRRSFNDFNEEVHFCFNFRNPFYFIRRLRRNSSDTTYLALKNGWKEVFDGNDDT